MAGLKLPIADSLMDEVGVNMAILTDFILARGLEPNGFEQKDGYRIFNFKEMDFDPFNSCIKCEIPMVQISMKNVCPLEMACPKCGHKEYALIQVPPPWKPREQTLPNSTDVKEEENESGMSIFTSGLPVSVGEPDNESFVIPLGWIILWVLVLSIGGIIAWIIFL